VTIALPRIFQVELLGEPFNGHGYQCVNGLVPPVPPTGPFTYTVDFYDTEISGPPSVLALRVGAPLPNAEVVRPYIGIAHISGKSITMPQAGLTLLAGKGVFRLLVEAEAWWYSVPRQHREDEYFDGQLVRRTATEHGVRTFTTIFRLGFTTAVVRDQ
jgi:hypothetical protein